ncbi:MAG: ABC transporter permease [Egibacteraceae bacterium]
MSAVGGALERLRGAGQQDRAVLRGGVLADRRRRTLAQIGMAAAVLVVIIVAGTAMAPAAGLTDLAARRLPPSLAHPFGTDWLGRDMLARTLVGLRLSLAVGTIAASVSAVLALVLGAAAGALGRWADTAVSWLVDLFLALPHLVLLILIAFAAGRGARGVIIAVAVTHWPSLTRLLRGEARRVAASDYVAAAHRLGRGGWWIARRHLGRHLMPQFTVGLVLLFPHAILHEAALSFLGLGLSPHAPAIGIILSDAMRYLSAGAWWLALFPGLALLFAVKCVDVIGENLRALLDPRSVHE